MGSRLLSALLSGVYRAFPFASNNEAQDIIESHVPMLFQLVHSKNFNIGVQALMLLDKISSKNKVICDRFYRALYSKLLLPSAMNTSKEEMFIGLLSRAMKNDLNLKRVSAFAKRLLQVALQQPPQYACACLFLLSEVLKSRPLLWNMLLQNEMADEELEHFEDIVEEPDIQLASKTADKQDSKGADDNHKDKDDSSEDEPSPSSDDEYFSDEGDDDLLSFGGLTNLQEHERTLAQTTIQPRVKNANSSLPIGYNPRHREPAFCNADGVAWWELTVLAAHVHPSVSNMARTLLSGAHIVYNGNPLNDLSLGAFIDKFMGKKPKQRNWHGGTSQIEPHKQVDTKPLMRADDFLQLDEMDVAPEDVVFHRFYMNKMNNSNKKPKKKKKGAEEEELTGYEGQEDESENEEEIDAILDCTNPALDAYKSDEYDYDDLDQIADEDDTDLAEDDEVAGDCSSDDEVSTGEAEDGSDNEEKVFEIKPRKRKAGATPFASIEDYEHMFDDNQKKNKVSRNLSRVKRSNLKRMSAE